MADMIDANEAKARLGCDDATLQGYINNGTIRAQRTGGRILCNADDIAKLADGGDDDGTIVLTGDSDDLSIDLGKVVDDSSETIVQLRGGAPDDSSITFGDELEVVSFDDNAHTSERVFDETRQTGESGHLSFTDSNTAVMTAVGETAVGATTAFEPHGHARRTADSLDLADLPDPDHVGRRFLHCPLLRDGGGAQGRGHYV